MLERYKRWNWAWTLPVALRYEPVTKLLALRGLPPAPVCDIACGPRGGLASCGSFRTVGVDLSFRKGFRSDFPGVTPVVASAAALPFPDRSLGAAICLDLLEHLSLDLRAVVAEEAFRATRPDGLVVMGAPCGAEARCREQRLNDLYRARTGKDHPWLADHLAHEVLNPDDLRGLVEKAASRYWPRARLSVVPNESLRLSYWTNRVWWTVPALMQVQRLMFRPAYRLLRRMHGPPSYRTIVIAEGGE